MRVPLSWLTDYVDLPAADPDDIAHALDMLGHGVEDVQHLEVGWSGVVIGRVEQIEAHPDADQVRVTHVDVGDGDLHQIICGAWNFATGAVVPVAMPGAVLPGGFEIGRRRIRGVESHGMICSERELGLGEVHEGIMVLADDDPVGKPFDDVVDLPDVVFELEITNNRPDVMGMIGVARELAAWYDVPWRGPDPGLPTVPGDPGVVVTITAADGCNRFVARRVDGVTVGPSPLWMRERLRRSGVRAISNVVDVTNYVMLETGHPLHAFDAERIVGDVLDVRWATSGERLETLDGMERHLDDRDLVIADTDGPTSLAAVMGGARSEVVETTRAVLMEAASWDPPTVMYTSRRHDLRSEASARFERGVDPNLAPTANARACGLLAQIGGGSVRDEAVDVVANPSTPATIDLDLRQVTRILGPGYDTDRAAGLLRRLHLDVETGGNMMKVTVPTYRPDLTRPADLVEEIARLSDFDSFPETVPTGPAGGLSASQRRLRLLSGHLEGLGAVQAINLPFVSSRELEWFNPETVDRVVTVRNPLREDQSELRQSLLPALVRNVRDNLNRGAGSVVMFETGRVFYARPWEEDERVPDQPVRLGVVIAGAVGAETVGSGRSEADATTALAFVESIAVRLGLDITRNPAEPPGLHPTRSAELRLGEHRLGVAGEIHPQVANALDIGVRVGVVEVDLDPLVAASPPPQMSPVSTYPHVDFDLSFDVGDIPAATIVDVTRAASPLVEGVKVFDEYRPDDAARSLALRYRLRAPDRTLDAAEIGDTRQAMIAAAESVGARLRGAG